MERECLLSWRAAVAVCCLLGLMTLGAGTRAVADTRSPGLSVAMRFDSPPAGATGEGGEWIAAVTPQLILERLGPFTNWDIRAYRRYDSYQNSGALRESHDMASARISSTLAEHTAAVVAGSYFRSRDLLHPDPESQLTRSEMSRAAASAGLTFWRAEAGYDVDVVSFDDPGFDDGRTQSWNAAIFPLRSEQTRWVLGGRREEWTLRDVTTLSASVATLGVRRNHTPELSSELEIGVARVADDLEGSRRDELAVVAGMNGFGQVLGLPFDARARVQRDVTTTGLAEIWRSMAGARVGVSWERTLYAGGGIFDEPTRRDFVSVEAQDTLGGRSILAIRGSFRRDRPRSLAVGRVETYRASTSVSRELRTWLTGSVTYSLAHQIGTGGIDVADFDRKRVEMTLTAIYR